MALEIKLRPGTPEFRDVVLHDDPHSRKSGILGRGNGCGMAGGDPRQFIVMNCTHEDIWHELREEGLLDEALAVIARTLPPNLLIIDKTTGAPVERN